MVFFGDVDALGLVPLGDFAFESLKGVIETIAEDISHGDEFDRAFGVEGLSASPGAATTATDQADLDRVGVLREKLGGGGDRCDGRRRSSSFRGVATGERDQD